MTPSIFSRYFFIFNPPPYPPRLPLVPITRWHGMIIGNMFFAFADPVALYALASGKSRIGGPLGPDRNGQAKLFDLGILARECRASHGGVSCRFRRSIWQPIGDPAARVHPPHADSGTVAGSSISN